MKSRLLGLVFVLAVSTHSLEASANCLSQNIDTVLITSGLTLWGAAIIGGAFMIGWSTYPKGDYNQEYNCGDGQLSYCCIPLVESGKVKGTNCTTETVPNAKCTDGQYLFCTSGTPELVPAPYVLQKWAKDTQLAGAIIFSVTAAAALITGLAMVCA